MKRHRIILALVFLGGLFLAIALLWQPALRWIAQRVVLPQIEAKVGGEISVKDVRFSLFPPEVIVESFKLTMDEGPLRLVGVKRITVNPGAGLIFLGQVVIDHVEIDEPFIHIVPDIQSQVEPASETPISRIEIPSLKDLLRFEIRGFDVRDASLRVDLPGQGVQVQIGSGNATFTGNGQEERWGWEGDGVLYRAGRSFRMDQVSIVAIRRGSEVWLEKFGLQAAGTEVQIEGKAYPIADLKVFAKTNLNPLENALEELEVTAGPLNLAGSIEFVTELKGDWANPRMKGTLSYSDVKLDRRSFGNGNFSFSLKKDRLQKLEGKLQLPDATFDLKVGAVGLNFPGKFSLKARKASYRTIRTVSYPHSEAALDGWLDIDIDGNVGLSPFSLDANYRIQSDRLTMYVGEVMQPYLPFEFKKIRISGKVGRTQERNFFLDKGELRLDGGQGSFQFDFPKSGRVMAVWQAEIDRLEGLFPQGDQISGMGRVTGGLDVQDEAFTATLNMAISPFRYGQRIPLRLEGEVAFYEEGTLLKQFQLTGESGSLRLDGDLKDGEDGPIQLSVAWADFDLGWMSDVASRRYGFLKSMEGLSMGSLLLTGTSAHPEGDLKISASPFSWVENDFSDLQLNLLFKRDEWMLEKARLNWNDGEVLAQGIVGPTQFQEFEAQFTALPLSMLKLPDWLSEYVSRVSGNVRMDGDLENPRTTSNLSLFDPIHKWVDMGQCQLTTEGPLSQLNWTFNLRNHEIAAQGTMNVLDLSLFETRGSFKEFSLEPLYPQVRSSLSGNWSFKGDLERRTTWDGKLDVEFLRLEQGEWFLEPLSPFGLALNRGHLHWPRTQFKGPSTDFQIQGDIQATNQVSAKAHGTLALQILSMVDLDIMRAEGSADLDLAVDGSVASPNLHGSANVVNGLIQLKDVPHAIENLTLRTTLDQKRIFVDEVKANFAEGQVHGKGSVQMFSSGERANVAMDFRVDHVFLRVPAWLPAEISGNLSLFGGLERPTLQGDVLVHRATYRDQWDWKSRILTLGGGRRMGRVFGSDEERMLLNLRVRSDGPVIFIRNDIATATLRANLRVTGSDVAFGLLGRIEIVEGEVDFLDNTFDLVSGTVNFTSEQNVKTNVDVSARTRVLDTDIFLDLRSEGNDVQAFLSSQPAKDETNIVAMLTLGVDSDELLEAGASNQDLSSSLLPTVLSGPIQSRLESGLKRAKIIDTFQFVPYFSETTRSTGLKMIVGKKVLPSVQLLYATDLFELGSENTIRIEQRLNRNFSMQGSLRENRPEDQNEYDLGVDFEFGFEF